MLLEFMESAFLVALLVRHTKIIGAYSLGPLAALAVGAAFNAIGGAIAGRATARAQGQADLAVAREQNRGALERQNDQQAFDQFLIDRRNVAGGPAYGGPGAESLPDFWSGAISEGTRTGIRDFFGTMKRTQEVRGSRRSIAPETNLFYQRGSRDVNAPLDYGVRDEYQNPLYNLRKLLGLPATTLDDPNAPRDTNLTSILKQRLGGDYS